MATTVIIAIATTAIFAVLLVAVGTVIAQQLQRIANVFERAEAKDTTVSGSALMDFGVPLVTEKSVLPNPPPSAAEIRASGNTLHVPPDLAAMFGLTPDGKRAASAEDLE